MSEYIIWIKANIVWSLTMSFLRSFKNIFRLGGDDTSKKKGINPNIKKDIDPFQFWEIIGELGDGAFGKVYKVIFLLHQEISLD